MYDKFKTQILMWYKEHPATTIVAGVALVLTVGVLVFFGSNSTLFQGELNVQLAKPIGTQAIGVSDILKAPNSLVLNQVKTPPKLQNFVITDKVDNLAEKFVIDETTTNTDVLPIASNVTIDGELIVGTTLTGNHNYTDADNDVEAGTTYRWLSGTSTTQTDVKSTETTYVLTEADLGKYVIFEVTPKNAKGTGAALSSSIAGPVVAAAQNDTPPVATNVVAGGGLTVGATLSGTHTYADAEGDEEDGSTYRWLSGTDTQQSNVASTNMTYPVTAADIGKYFVFEVTPKNVNGTGSPTLSAAVGPIVAATPAGTAPVATNVEIVGDPLVGAALIGNYQYVDAQGDAEAASIYNWYTVDAAGTIVTTLNVNDNLYQPTDADVGTYLAFGYIPLSATAPTTGVEVISDPFGPILAADVAPPPPDTTPPPADPMPPPPDVTYETPDATVPPANTANQNTNLTLTSNTNANLLGAAEVAGNTGPEALLILPFLGFISLRLGRRLAKRK